LSDLKLTQLGICVDILKMTQTLLKFVAGTAPIQNHSNKERHLYSRANFKLNRAAAIAEWRQLLSV